MAKFLLFFKIMALNLSKSLRVVLLLWASSFFPQAVLAKESVILAASQAFLRNELDLPDSSSCRSLKDGNFEISERNSLDGVDFSSNS